MTNTGGTWANADSVLTANATGNLAAAHIFVTASPAVGSAGALVTGFATGRSTSAPEPATLFLFGSGMIGSWGFRRFKRRFKK